jgi:hypothetical protein
MLSRYPSLLLLLISLLAAACANPGSGPDGGPYDETPPRIIGTSPVLGQRQSDAKKVSIYFDEMIKVQNAAEKVVVSPPQLETPEIKVSGRRITVGLLDTLRANTTYTIDFSDAIEDSNEGNPLGNYTYYFSTGEQLDTMEVSGTVLAAQDLEPIKGILVGLHADTTDTAFLARPFDRVARTDSRGHFCIKGVAPGTYRAYALKDVDGDFRKSRGEMMAVLRQTFTPSSYPDVRYDTVWHDSLRYDSIRRIAFTHYLPDDLVLLAYTETNTQRHYLKAQRDVPESFRTFFTAPSTHIPVVKGLNFNADSLLLQQRSPGNDTITYWLRDLHLPQVDTLQMAYTYEAFDDSLGANALRTDTLTLVPRQTMARRLKQQEEAHEKWLKQLERRHKKGDFSQETPPQTYLRVGQQNTTGFSPIQNPVFTLTQPLQRLDTAAIHLFLRRDSLLVAAPMQVEADTPMLQFLVRGEWRYGQHYELHIDSAALVGLYGDVNAPMNVNLSVGREEDYGSLFFSLVGADTCATVQLMESDNKVARQVRSRHGRADFYYVHPGTYYVRLFNDRNGNGRWDPGDYDARREAEEVYYYPTALEVRANWDIEQTWDVKALPLTAQKPEAITKQKADSEKQTAHQRNVERLRNKNN